jgi:transposase
MIREIAATYGVSKTTVYRALHAYTTPRAVHRGDRGTPRVLPQDQLERYCELIAAMKLRTANKQGRHLSTAETIRLLEDYGVETPDGFVRAQRPPETQHRQSLFETLGV